MQAEVSISPAKGLDFKAAYKYYDVQTQFTKGQLEKTLTPKHRWFANVAYETADTHDNKHSQWKFDVTFKLARWTTIAFYGYQPYTLPIEWLRTVIRYT